MTAAQLIADAHHMLLNGPEPAELVGYVPHQGVLKQVAMVVSRRPVEVEFTGAPVVEYDAYLVNDATLGVACIHDGKDQVHAKAQLGDTHDSIFRVVGHQSTTGMHTIRMRL